MLFDLYTNYNLVSGKQYKQKLRPQNSQKKGYMYCLIKMYELTGEIFSVSLLFVRLDNGVLYEKMGCCSHTTIPRGVLA